LRLTCDIAISHKFGKILRYIIPITIKIAISFDVLGANIFVSFFSHLFSNCLRS